MDLKQLPLSHRMIDVYTGPGITRHVGCSYSTDRGFFEPITNTSFANVGLEVTKWHYSPVPLWPGAEIFHRKRGSTYRVIHIVSGLGIAEAEDDAILDASMANLFYDISPENVMIQKSTENHSPESAIYKSEVGMLFVRPLSEFTEDRFKILYNGA